MSLGLCAFLEDLELNEVVPQPLQITLFLMSDNFMGVRHLFVKAVERAYGISQWDSEKFQNEIYHIRLDIDDLSNAFPVSILTPDPTYNPNDLADSMIHSKHLWTSRDKAIELVTFYIEFRKACRLTYESRPRVSFSLARWVDMCDLYIRQPLCACRLSDWNNWERVEHPSAEGMMLFMEEAKRQ